MDVDLIVLGSGPAGLAAAWRAARRGLSVTVLERADRVGGLAGSFEVAGVRVDHGSHRLHPATPPELLADLRTLLGEDLQTRPRNGRLRLAGSWVGFPLRPAELVRALPVRTMARVGVDTLTAPLRRTGPPSFASVLRKGLGPTLYEQMYAPYAVKLWGLPGEEISADQAAKRVTADTPWKVAARVLRLDSAARAGQGRVFHYPRRGFGQIVEALAEAALDAGAQVQLGAEVTQVRQLGPQVDGGRGGPSVEVVTADGEALQAGHVFSTAPLTVLARLVRPGPPESVLAAAARLTFRAMVLVYLEHRGGRWTQYDAHYLPGPETPVTRLSEPTNYRRSDEDPLDRSVVCAELPCRVGDSVWSASPQELTDLVQSTLRSTDLPELRPGEVVVERLPFVYPVYDHEYALNLAGLDAWAGSLERITTFGRLGLFAHDNTHHALAMAYAAVDALGPHGEWDAAEWAAARQRFASHVVED